MANTYRLDDIFGYMPFDHFLVEKWDPDSSLDQEVQEKSLVKTWFSLGKHGRSAYIQRCREVGEIPLPDHIPKDLSAFEKRQTVDPDEWSGASAIWIRTWYGTEADVKDGLDEETVTHANSDAAYGRLWRKALWPPGKHGFDNSIFGPYVFDDNAAAYGVSARNVDDALELMGEMPSFVLNALARCPDAMEGGSGRDTGEEDEDLTWSQALLVVVADREACEDGWVLLIALNGKGQVLYKRIRCKASDVEQSVAFWRDGGEPLDIENLRENLIDYLDPNQSGNGWDDG